MPEDQKELRKFAALARKSKNEPFVYCTIYAVSKEEAEEWFGLRGYEIDGSVRAK